ncbi:hypothetical protein ACJX0J_032036, partial [Zea mays]
AVIIIIPNIRTIKNTINEESKYLLLLYHIGLNVFYIYIYIVYMDIEDNFIKKHIHIFNIDLPFLHLYSKSGHNFSRLYVDALYMLSADHFSAKLSTSKCFLEKLSIHSTTLHLGHV